MVCGRLEIRMNENIDSELKALIPKLNLKSRKNLISAVNFHLAQQHTTSQVREFSSCYQASKFQ
jgi:hypothetical protein